LGADCLELAEHHLIKEQWSSAEALQEMRDDSQRQIEEAVATTLREPLPDPNNEDWCPLATRNLCEGSSSE
jgi:TPP-dependent pyruvate/acetoin dehydrogenase alpha subunit